MEKPLPSPPLAQRTLTSLGWNVLANLVTLPVSALQTVLLARLLPVEYFGIQGGLAALINLIYPFFEFGQAFAAIHRSPHSEDEEPTLALFFTLRLIGTTLWALGMALLGWLAFEGVRQQVLLALVAATWLHRITLSGHVLLIRRVQHQRLAVIEIVQTAVVFVVVLFIAFRWRSIYALVAAPALQALVSGLGLFVFRPIWRPRLAWNPAGVRYFLGFGSRAVGAQALSNALEYLDDLFTSVYLGDRALGYYSRAYRFATYPRLILAEVMGSLSLGLYAELKDAPSRLARAFYQTNALLVRSGFLLAGWLALIAPQFVALFLGEKWLPMVGVFRLMLLYALLEPLRTTLTHLLVAVGKPEQTSLARLLQLGALGLGLFTLGRRWDIYGVALAVDGMIMVGIGTLLIYARRAVPLSLGRLFAAPTFSLVAGLAAGLALAQLATSEVRILTLRSLGFLAVYAVGLLALEWRAWGETLRQARAALRAAPPLDPGEQP